MRLIYYYDRGVVIDWVCTDDPKMIFRNGNSDRNTPVEYALECYITSSEGKKLHTSANVYKVVKQRGTMLEVERIKGDKVPYYIREEMYDPDGIRSRVKALSYSAEVQK